MQFNNSIETSARAQTPSEELDMLQERIAQLQERLGVTKPSQQEKERIASQELSAYKETPTDHVLDPQLQMDKKEIDNASKKLMRQQEGKTNELLEILVEKGVKNTLDVIKKMDDPYTEDDFHRLLVQYLADGMDVRGLKEGTPLFKALHMTLFEVTLPDIVDVEQGFSQLVTTMEQFYSGMLSIRERHRLQGYFTLEIALSNTKEDVVFYVAVPNTKISLFEKQLASTFPDAQITQRKNDYNPFNKEGFSVGSVAKLTKSAALPLKTFEEFEQDPVNVLLGVFSKLKKEGEGAAIQLIIAPVRDEINRKYQEVLKDVKKGTSLNRALEGSAVRVAREVASVAKELVLGAESKEQRKERKEKELTTVDQEEVDAITEKISSPIVNANIRIIGSAATAERADEILTDLESAFHQFANEPANSISFRRVSGDGLEKLLHDFSFRLYMEKYAMRLNLKEMTTMFHFPVMDTSSSQLKQSKIVSAVAPVEMEARGVFLGTNTYRGAEKNVYIAPEDRLRHFYCIGQTGTGKTTLLKNMIMQDINNGEGVCYIDPHGTDIEDILNTIPEHRMKDVIYFDPGDVERPMGLNMLEYDVTHPEQKSFVINEMLSIFNKLFDMKVAGGPMFEQYFRNATSLVIEDPESGNTLLDVSRVLADQKFRELKLSRCTNPIVVQFWREIAAKAGGEASLANMVPYITNKFDVFLSNDIMRPIVAQEHSSFNFREIMDDRKVLLVNLAKGRLGEINSHLIGLILVGKIFMSALSRVDAKESAPAEFYLYIDEFQNVTTDSISAILSEARKYRLGLTIAHQFIAQLDEEIRDSVFGNVGSMAAFRIGAEDAEFVESQFLPTFSATDIMKIPNRNAYVKMLVNGFPSKPFNIETQAPMVGSPEIGQKIKELSRQTYGRDRKEVDEIVAKKYAYTTASPKINTRHSVQKTGTSVSTVSRRPAMVEPKQTQQPTTPVSSAVTQTGSKNAIIPKQDISTVQQQKQTILSSQQTQLIASPKIRMPVHTDPFAEAGDSPQVSSVSPGVDIPKYGFDEHTSQDMTGDKGSQSPKKNSGSEDIVKDKKQNVDPLAASLYLQTDVASKRDPVTQEIKDPTTQEEEKSKDLYREKL